MSHYDHISAEEFANYAAKEFGTGFPKDLEVMTKFFPKKSPKDLSVLEIGCGWGRLGKFLLKKYHYVGIDIFTPYLKYFRSQLVQENIVDQNIQEVSFESFVWDQQFDVILFPWTVIWDFSLEEQVISLEKSYKLLKKGGVVLLDNPAPQTPYSQSVGYTPTKFYCHEWEESFAAFGFMKTQVFEYVTLSGKVREISVLHK